MAIGIAESGLFGAKTPEHAFALMLVAQAEGRHPATIAQEYDIIQGRPALKSQSALARFQAAGGRIQWVERSDLACEARFVHEQGGELTIRWTMERAKAAQLTSKDNWKRFPAQMLSARVNVLQILAPLCGGKIVAVQQQFRESDDRIQRRAQFVTHIREEARLRLACRFGA